MTNDSNTREKKFEQAAQELAQYIMVHEGNDYREFVEEGGDPRIHIFYSAHVIKGIESMLIDDVYEYLEEQATLKMDVDQLMAKDLWGEHPEHTRKDWCEEVSEGNVQSGYWEWVRSTVEQEKHDK